MTEAGLLAESVDATASSVEGSPPAKPQSRLCTVAEIAALVCLFTGIVGGWSWWATGSSSLILPYVQGQRLFFDPLEIVINDAEPGASVERTVRVVNLTGSKVTLLGSQQSCGCITLDEFPEEIEDGKSYEVNIRFKISPESGGFEHSITLFLDSNGTQSVVIAVLENVK